MLQTLPFLAVGNDEEVHKACPFSNKYISACAVQYENTFRSSGHIVFDMLQAFPRGRDARTFRSASATEPSQTHMGELQSNNGSRLARPSSETRVELPKTIDQNKMAQALSSRFECLLRVQDNGSVENLQLVRWELRSLSTEQPKTSHRVDTVASEAVVSLRGSCTRKGRKTWTAIFRRQSSFPPAPADWIVGNVPRMRAA
ncbi:hypothetical protein B0H16DRAFT_749750 [Mycena metata]|uniref:Uncharacterized protein n=1 Tax=Mycena metata TaxID=1033252 RepID=A0AAD7J121_9AGAR|nr:hypothetical protein B0H16DRAFT_749750 [Mycena metata]